MLRKFCFEDKADWDEGVPYVLFAIRETVQESLGFSPAELVFGHTPRGPLAVIKEKILSAELPKTLSATVCDYVQRMRNRLQDACELAHSSLLAAQVKMKHRYDITAKSRKFEKGDQVLVLLPVQGSSLSARYSGPHLVERKLSDTS